MVDLVRGGAAYNANETEGMSDFSALPTADYIAQIVGSEEKPTKKNKANQECKDTYINLEFIVLAGDYKGRKFWTILNTNNSSKDAVEMAYKELTSIMDAIGKPKATKTEELHGIPMLVSLKEIKAGPNTIAGNDVMKYSKADGSVPASVPAASEGGETAKAKGGGTPVWAQ